MWGRRSSIGDVGNHHDQVLSASADEVAKPKATRRRQGWMFVRHSNQHAKAHRFGGGMTRVLYAECSKVLERLKLRL
jgi:hypothetical protein